MDSSWWGYVMRSASNTFNSLWPSNTGTNETKIIRELSQQYHIDKLECLNCDRAFISGRKVEYKINLSYNASSCVITLHSASLVWNRREVSLNSQHDLTTEYLRADLEYFLVNREELIAQQTSERDIGIDRMSGNPQGEVEKIDLEESGFFVMKVYELSSLPEIDHSLLSQIRDLYSFTIFLFANLFREKLTPKYFVKPYVTANLAQERLKEWHKDLYFLPSNFHATVNYNGPATCILVPFFCTKYSVNVTYSGMIRDTKREREEAEKAERSWREEKESAKRKFGFEEGASPSAPPRVTQIFWKEVNGNYQNERILLKCATFSIKGDLVERLVRSSPCPFGSVDILKENTPEDISEQCTVYPVDLEPEKATVYQLMELHRKEEEESRRRISHYEFCCRTDIKDFDMNLKWEKLSHEVILLPIYSCKYSYNETEYEYITSGRTDAAAIDRPWGAGTLGNIPGVQYISGFFWGSGATTQK